MTPEEIEVFEAGRELDALVAQSVFGWRECDHSEKSMPWEFTDPPGDRITVGIGLYPVREGEYKRGLIPSYSIDIVAAWEVLEKLNLSVLRLTQNQWSERDKTGWACGLWPEYEYECDGCYDGDYLYWAEADTAPLAICRAALLSVLPN